MLDADRLFNSSAIISLIFLMTSLIFEHSQLTKLTAYLSSYSIGADKLSVSQ